ncbi:endonuclease domain-containing protein [Bacteroidota bacterium]
MPVLSKKKVVELCRELRRNSTGSENILWANLRNRRLSGKKFNRQFPIIYQSTIDLHYFFVADFYCHEKKLVIEVDGKIHEYQKDYDEGRTAIIEQLGIRVIRFTNEELSEDISRVLAAIRKTVE